MAAGSIIVELMANTGSFETDTQRAAKALKVLKNGLYEVKTETETLNVKFDSLTNTFRQVSSAQNNMSAAVQKNQGAFRSANQVIQNTSYQITDFVVQVTGGVSAMRAFSQQAPQFLGAFGPTGAMLGVFAALAGAFAPIVVEAINGASAIKEFDVALRESENALGSVMSIGRTFDMTPVVKQFNDADAATRQSIIQLMNYKKALIDIANIDLRKSFTEEVKGLTDTGFFEQFSDSLPSANFADKMGIAQNKELYADLRVLRYEYGSVQEFADKYAVTLAKGNKEGRAFANMVVEMARSLKEGELATKAINEAQSKMAAAGATGMIATGDGKAPKATKADNTLEKMFNNQRVGADKFVESMQRANEQVEFQSSLLGKSSQEVEILNAQYRIQAELEKTIQDIERQNGTIRTEEFERMKSAAAEALAIQTNAIMARQEMERSASYGIERSMKSYAESAGNAAKGMESVFNNAFKGMENALVQFAMTGKMNFGDMVNAMIADLIRFQMQMALAGLAKMAISAFAGSASSSGGMSSSTQAATYGGAKPMFGFADGGYTGDGGKYQPAGIVHAGEFVMNKQATSRIGVGNLYKMMRGYADGGLVGSAPLAGGGNAGGGNININVTNEAGGDGYQATAKARKNDSGFDIDIMVRKAVNADLMRNGPMAQQMSSVFNLRRQS